MVQELRLESFDSRNEGIQTGAVFTSRRGLRCCKRTWSSLSMESTRTCSRGDKCSFWKDRDERAEPRPKTHHPVSHHKRGRSSSRERISEAGVHLGSSIESSAKTY